MFVPGRPWRMSGANSGPAGGRTCARPTKFSHPSQVCGKCIKGSHAECVQPSAKPFPPPECHKYPSATIRFFSCRGERSLPPPPVKSRRFRPAGRTDRLVALALVALAPMCLFCGSSYSNVAHGDTFFLKGGYTLVVNGTGCHDGLPRRQTTPTIDNLVFH